MPLKVLQEAAGIKHIVGVAAGKGGVGKSSFTALLAKAYKHMGFRTAVLDADIYGPSLARMLPPTRKAEEKQGVYIPALCDGIELISMGVFRGEEQANIVRAPIANRLIQQFLSQTKWNAPDILLIDFPPGTGDIHITLAQHASLSGAVIVTTPQKVSLSDVKKCIQMFQEVKVPLLGVVENMSYFIPKNGGGKEYIFGQGGGQLMAAERGLPFLGEIPLEPLISASLDEGICFYNNQDDASKRISQLFFNLAQNILGRLESIKQESSKAHHGIRSIDQDHPFGFSIAWADGLTTSYRFSDLQNECPCAGCLERSKNQSLSMPESVTAKRILPVGKYAIKIEFASGCSAGIYDFDFLKAFKPKVFGGKQSQ